MELWLRFSKAVNLQWDSKIRVCSQEEWQSIISHYKPISSILWPQKPLFPLKPMSKSSCFKRRHSHEKSYKNDPSRNSSYLDAAQRLAFKIKEIIRDRKALVYVPMRGALPIWKAVHQFIPNLHMDCYYPVTSSFVFYSRGDRIMNSKGKFASGRFANILELQRLRPLLKRYEYLLYIDEIVSGGMMAAYIKEMTKLEIQRDIKIIAAGIADANGDRSILKREKITFYEEAGKIYKFFWQGCNSLITQDQKFLLGVHYVDYHSGLNIIPFLNKNLEYYPEKKEFDKDIFIGGGDNA